MKKKYADGGIYTAEMGQPPQDIDGASAMPRPKKAMPAEGRTMKREGRGMAKADMQKKMAPKAYAKGGSVSSRADGIAKKGRTNCKMV